MYIFAYIFSHFSPLRWWLKSFIKNQFFLCSEYHGCWWPGDTRRQVISSHAFDLVLPEYSVHSTRRVNSIWNTPLPYLCMGNFQNSLFFNEHFIYALSNAYFISTSICSPYHWLPYCAHIETCCFHLNAHDVLFAFNWFELNEHSINFCETMCKQNILKRKMLKIIV